MDAKEHWERVYSTRKADQLSWFRPHLEISLAWIEGVAPDHASRIIDVGGGESTLADDLLVRGYSNLTVLDVSPSAIAAMMERLGEQADKVRWLCADVTEAELPAASYDVWHDRAVFHFLLEREQRAAYVRNLERSLRDGGHAILAAFGPEGPKRCSGLEVMRYDAESLHRELGAGFRLVDSAWELHRTPSGASQQFLYCCFKLER